MRVDTLTLKQFRNYAGQSLTFSPGKNIILGANAQGKTNVLEALYFLSHGRSHRAGTDRELIRFGSDFTTLSATVESQQSLEGQPQRQLVVTVATDATGRLKSKFQHNGVTAKSRSDFLGYLPSVSFLTPDLNLLRGTPDDRRRWLDGALVQYDHRYFSVLAAFNRIRQQKGRLLKLLIYPANPESLSQLTVWNQQFAAAAAQVLAYRLTYMRCIQQLTPLRYETLSGGQEALRIQYQAKRLVIDSAETEGSVLAWTEWLTPLFLEALVTNQAEEIRRQQCLVGPHRDDVIFSLTAPHGAWHLATDYGSQGQQRSIVLALKLTELQLLQSQQQETPILLLDDVMAELDPLRQQWLMDAIGDDLQVFITTTHLDASLSPIIARYLDADQTHIFEVDQGYATVRGVCGVR